jgi:hypothetical protein
VNFDAQLVKPSGEARVSSMIENNETSVHGPHSPVDFDLVGVGMTAQTMLGFQQGYPGTLQQVPACGQARDAAADHHDVGSVIGLGYRLRSRPHVLTEAVSRDRCGRMQSDCGWTRNFRFRL